MTKNLHEVAYPVGVPVSHAPTQIEVVGKPGVPVEPPPPVKPPVIDTKPPVVTNPIPPVPDHPDNPPVES